MALQIENQYLKGSDLGVTKQKDGRKSTERERQRGVSAESFPLSMAHLLHSCPSSSSLSSSQQLICAPGSLDQSLLSGSSSSSFSASEGEAGVRGRAGQGHRPQGITAFSLHAPRTSWVWNLWLTDMSWAGSGWKAGKRNVLIQLWKLVVWGIQFLSRAEDT